ncbi:hypothetical protein D1AOALGA4SA_10347 [Olavius algarvensis Delta 1 endosymbiont]|nr:hypothetical protein D1AOALGA4SA_10347 [Olavius algarvensis Delta 1 endosymbiont]
MFTKPFHPVGESGHSKLLSLRINLKLIRINYKIVGPTF